MTDARPAVIFVCPIMDLTEPTAQLFFLASDPENASANHSISDLSPMAVPVPCASIMVTLPISTSASA